MDFSWLTQMRWEDLSLTRPLWLWLFALLPLFPLIQRFSLVDLTRFQQFLSFFVRTLIFILLIFALAGLSKKNFTQDMTLVLAVDVSPSVPDIALKRAQTYLNLLWKQRRDKDHFHVITFASSSRLLASKSEKPPLIERHRGEKSSDIQAAIRHAYTLYAPETLKRLLLLTDGRETRGSALEEAARAARRGIRLFTVPIKGPYPPEVLIKDLRTPEKVRLHASFWLTVQVFSSYKAHRIPLTIYKNGFIFAHRRVDLKVGLQQFRFRARAEESGLLTFQAVLSPKKGPRFDHFRGNNIFIKAIPVKGEPRILYLEGSPSKAHYLATALRKQRIRVDVRSSYGVPTSIRDLARYDLVLISDVPAERMTSAQMRLLATYARDLGGGVIMVGGENSFGPGGYFQTPMERMLPVRFDMNKKKNTPSLALVMVIDKSGSMSSGNRIALARKAAKLTVQMLGRNDKVGVVAFDSTPRKVVPLQSAANKSQILLDISRIPASGGTRIAPALQMAYEMLTSIQAKIKHVILLSDGRDSRRGIFEIVQSMNGEGITVSAIAVGSGSDQGLLRSIAEMGGGRFYYTESAYNVPKIFTKETSKVSRSSFIEEPFRPRVVRFSQAIKGINFSSAPYLLGYVSTKLKPRSHLILSTEYGEPLLVSWRYGLGKVVAFTSDVKNRWAAQWLTWSGFGKFWAQVIRDTMRQASNQNFSAKAEIKGGHGIIHVDAIDMSGKYIDFLSAKAIILDPRLRRSLVSLHQVAPGFYEGDFVAHRYGSYMIKIQFFNPKGRLVGRTETSASYSYPAEWLTTGPDLHLLKAMARSGIGLFDPLPSDLWKRSKEEKIIAHLPLWPSLVLLALFLFLFDLLLRRIRFFGRAEILSQDSL